MTAVQLNPTARTSGRSVSHHRQTVRLRALELMQKEIDFIPHADFQDAAEHDDENVAATLRAAGKTAKAPADLPAHLRRLCEADLLTHEQERALFREMNYLKFRAHSLRSALDPEKAEQQDIEVIESLIARSQAVRDHIIKANMRLVISIVKRFVTPQQSFDDMLSEGTFTLMQAVDKFDFDRGFRFSTYAYRSIARTAYRSIATARQEASRFARDAEEWAPEQEEARSSSSMSDHVWSNLRELTASLLDRLDRRERFIIRSRYALGAHRKVRTCQYLADRLGISKERVRQLEQRAVAKLRAMVDDCDVDERFWATIF